MHLNPDVTSLVLAGMWNPAILNPDWIVHRAFEIPPGTAVNVQMEQILLGPAQPPSFIIEGIKFTSLRNRLVLRPTANTQENYALTQRIAVRILNLLPHTPMGAVGQNFEFLENTPTEPQLAIFAAVSDLAQHLDFEFETVGTQLISSIRFEDRLLNLTRANTGGRLQLKFNYHYELATAEAAAQRLADDTLLWQNLTFALRIIQRVYGIEVDVADPPPAPAQPQLAPAIPT